MKTNTIPREDHQIQLNVEIDDQELMTAKQQAARKIAGKSKIPGFRPGKAPYQIVLRHVGESAIIEEAIEILANDVYPKALDESGIKPYGPGTLQNVTKSEPITLEFIVPLEAEVVLGNYREIRLPYEKPEVSDTEVNEVIENLRNRHAILQTVDREAKPGDQINLLMRAERLQPVSDENPLLISERTLDIVIKNQEDIDPNEWPYPGFSLNLIGLKKGDEKDVIYTFSEDTAYESLRGITVSFHFSVLEISSRSLPELNDDFGKIVGNYDNLDDLIKEISTSIGENKVTTYNTEYEENVLSLILRDSTVTYPPLMLEREIDNQLTNIDNRLKSQGLDLDLYLKTRQMDSDALREEVTPEAENNLRRSLVLYELAAKEDIKISTDELQSETHKTVNSLFQVLPQNEVKQLSNKRVLGNIANNVMVDLLTRKTLERIRNIAAGLNEETGDLTSGIPQEINDKTPHVDVDNFNYNSVQETTSDEES